MLTHGVFDPQDRATTVVECSVRLRLASSIRELLPVGDVSSYGRPAAAVAETRHNHHSAGVPKVSIDGKVG
jgi:hypothetical protein